MMGTLDRLAKEFVAKLLADLDVDGSHYSPDLRDCLHDHRKWLEDEIADFLESGIDEIR